MFHIQFTLQRNFINIVLSTRFAKNAAIN
jgi:hypothetical protein